jgi:hypothetical protein
MKTTNAGGGTTMTDKPDWEKRMVYWILEAEKEKSWADNIEKRLYFSNTENEIIERKHKGTRRYSKGI